MALFNFDSTNVQQLQEKGEFQLLPDGWYNVTINNSEMKDNKTGTGQYLQLQFNVIDGEHKGAVVFNRLNLIHSNSTAVEIARQELSTICHTVNVFQIQDTQQLHGIPLQIKVKIAENGQYKNNEIVAYKKYEGASQQAPATGTPTWANQQQQQQTNIMPPSWTPQNNNNNGNNGVPF